MTSRVQISRGVVIHGGVGTVSREALTADLEAGYRAVLTESLVAGNRVLEDGGTSVDATVAAVQVMEDSPLFNAGRGSNYDERGVVTMDASIMDGSTFEAGAVAGVTGVRSSVHLAQLVMERSEHLMLIGEGAEAFARQQGIEETLADFFHTDRRWAEMEAAKEAADATGGAARPNVLGDAPPSPSGDGKSGTVGAVAIDGAGRLAAATSTGGMANKTWGRVGDSPIIGAGTYASSRCAVSCTGWGEYFIKNATAFDVHARMEHAGALLADAVHQVIFDVLGTQVPRSGGLVALDAEGRVELCFNTSGMYRGWIDSDGEPHVEIYAHP
jgi:beta-aspartyl-peptidase (threonine type)